MFEWIDFDHIITYTSTAEKEKFKDNFFSDISGPDTSIERYSCNMAAMFCTGESMPWLHVHTQILIICSRLNTRKFNELFFIENYSLIFSEMYNFTSFKKITFKL